MIKVILPVMALLALDSVPIVPQRGDPSPYLALDGLSRIVSITADDSGGGESTASLDVTQLTCDDSSEEPFFDTLLKISVSNTTSTTFFIRRVSFIVRNPYGSGGVFRSKRFALVGSGEVPSETGNVELKALFLDVLGSGKAYAGGSTAIPANLGFRNVRVKLQGHDARGRAVTLRGRTVLSFDAVDRCT